MKANIHPTYHDVDISCACGAVLKCRSTEPHIRLDICGACHPFFTGTQKIVDTEGRIERFRKKYTKQDTKPSAKPSAKSTSAKSKK